MTTDDYLELPYTLALKRDSDDEGNPGFVAKAIELPGCVAQGATEAEALDNLREAMAGWLDVALTNGAEIPLPKDDSRYSGRILLRLPVSLHAELARAAEAEGTSLNQLLVGALAAAVGWRAGRQPESEPSAGLDFGLVAMNAPAKSYNFSFRREPIDYITIDALPLKGHSVNTLKRAGVGTVGELVSKKPEDLRSIPSFGEKSLADVRTKLRAIGLELKTEK